MNIILNGKPRSVEDQQTVEQLVTALELTNQRIAIEVNQELVPRSTFSSTTLSEGDEVEIVGAIGGG
ncbi:MAG: Unknown protein [uncultured Thiotrichaceae bacterium]|uniref:Sulfur carrier protein ThiS n=1 Tax=uncultured Thiotrichaceae bacterium TaxID=298394 RepID=A0A6S6UBL9_9GAMM|nr:MAG: Unknown protein [uncultured Thiotrichaceae bacterium]